MNTAKIYYDSDGKERTIQQMVKYEPEWAANIIQFYEEKISKLEKEGFVLMPRKLTAENGAKLLLSGKFFEIEDIECPEKCDLDEGCMVCNGSGIVKMWIPVSWNTIKRIYERAVTHFDSYGFRFEGTNTETDQTPNK